MRYIFLKKYVPFRHIKISIKFNQFLSIEFSVDVNFLCDVMTIVVVHPRKGENDTKKDMFCWFLFPHIFLKKDSFFFIFEKLLISIFLAGNDGILINSNLFFLCNYLLNYFFSR